MRKKFFSVCSVRSVVRFLGLAFDADALQLDALNRRLAVDGNSLDGINHLHAVDDLAERRVLPVERGASSGGNEE